MDDSAKFAGILKITHELLQIQDLDMLLERMLTEVRAIVNADAGSIYIVEGANLKFSYTQNSTLQKRLPFGKKLIYSTFNIKINNQSIAGYVANTGLSVNLADAYHLNVSQPYSFDKHFDEATGYRTRSMLSVPIKIPGGKIKGVLQLINALQADEIIRSFTAIEESIVQFFADSAALTIEHAQMTRSMIVRMDKMIELHDPNETVQHASRVAAYTVEIYEAWAHKKGVPERETQHIRDTLRMATMFHNIGKIAVPSLILQKSPTELTAEERKIRQQHTIYGARLFTDVYSDFEEMARAIALTHHERWDGSGYPGHVSVESGLPLPGYEKSPGVAFGKSGLEIPLYGRLVAIANTYDNLINKIIDGKERFSDQATKDQALEMILAGSGTQFDPEIVAAFVNCLEVINAISSNYN